jgi:predicted PurR-regulated permease PerM
METAALVTSLILSGVLGLTARDRWQSLKQYDNTSIFVTRWFAIAMVTILTLSILTLLVISIIQYRGELKVWWKNRPHRAEENRRQKAEEKQLKIEEKKQAAVGQMETNSAASYKNELKELGQIADSKVVNIARQISTLIDSAGLNDEQAANLVDYLVTRYAPIDGQYVIERSGVEK